MPKMRATTTCRSCSGTRPNRSPKPIRIAPSPSPSPAAKPFRCCANSCCAASAASIKTPASPSSSSGLAQSNDADEQLTIIRGLRTALSGQRRANAPTGWQAAYNKLAKSSSAELKSEANALGVTFGDAAAMESLRSLVASAECRCRTAPRRPQSAARCERPEARRHTSVAPRRSALRDAALTGLALYDDPHTPAKILAAYSQLIANEKRAALATLASRIPYGLDLLKAVSAKQIPAKDLSADLVRQLHNLKDETIDKMIGDVWGQIRTTPADKAALIESYRKQVTAKDAADADPALGRAVFTKTCQQCHTLYGVGTNIGPDLTGSNRSDVEYLLSNIVDPSAVIAKEYRPTIVVSTDGRVITGIVAGEDDKSLTLRTATETVVLPKDEIDERTVSDTSMMPDDQLKQFSTAEVLSLFAYLRGKQQVPILATKENAANFFNGKDLTGWNGDKELWSVENGEIVGRSQGLEHNTFLVSDLAAKDFKLTLEVKLVDDAGNSGIQFRSEPLEGYAEMRGYQADIGPGWWGKLYEENGRGLLWDKSGEEHVKKGDWNKYEIEAVGSHIRTWINGQPCVDSIDPEGKPSGIFALQLHSGGPTEVRFRNLKLEVKE